MILRSDITPIGRVNKTHGVRGELSVSFHQEILAAIEDGDLDCLIMDMDGIYVPFFVTEVRPRGGESLLITLEGVQTQQEAAEFSGKDVYALSREYDEFRDDDDPEHQGMLRSDSLIGYTAIEVVDQENERVLGTIEDIDLTTVNALFVIRTEDDQTILIPIADEFIEMIDEANSEIFFSLPEGMLED